LRRAWRASSSSAPAPLALDVVEVEQVPHVALRRGDPAGLDPGDLRGRAAQVGGDLVDADAGGVAQAAELAGEPAPQQRRIRPRAAAGGGHSAASDQPPDDHQDHQHGEPVELIPFRRAGLPEVFEQRRRSHAYPSSHLLR
jgi:hypothetical protein